MSYFLMKHSIWILNKLRKNTHGGISWKTEVSQYSVASIWPNSCFWQIKCIEINVTTKPQIPRYLHNLKIHLWTSQYYKIKHNMNFETSFNSLKLTLASASETSASKWLFDMISAIVTLKSKLTFNNPMINEIIVWITSSFFKGNKDCC